jgi:D-cysteine desulfhydrase
VVSASSGTLVGVTSTPRRKPLLFDAFPTLGGSLPWIPLADTPTGVDSCAPIAEWLGRREGVAMKRDDLVSTLYGGNKVRRFELVFGEALAQGKKRIVTVGGIASTQVMATVLFARSLGLPVRAVLFDQPLTRFAQDSLAGYAAAGAELVYGGGYAGTFVRALVAQQRGDGNYFLFPGASGPLANVGYVDAMLELGLQVERGEAERPDVIVLPTGSSGTVAALALGVAYLGWDTEVVGVRITSRAVCNRVVVARRIHATARFLRSRDPRFPDVAKKARFSLFQDACGEGYGYPTPQAIEGADMLEKLTGARGEVTYSGKALAGLRAMLAMPRYAKKRFLLWNTLSTPRPSVEGGRERLPKSLRWAFERPVVA